MVRKREERKELLEVVARPSFALFAVGAILCSALVCSSIQLDDPSAAPGFGGPLPDPAESIDGIPAPEDRGLYYVVYRVEKGDTISEIADSFNVTEDTIISFNDVRSSRTMQVGTYLKIPSVNGILYIGKKDDTVASIAKEYEISEAEDRIREFNALEGEEVREGAMLFLPDARLARFQLQEINGDLFLYPVRGYITSWFGYRSDPFSGVRSFHSGLDIGASYGTPVRAAMDGVVTATGYNNSAGNYIVIQHHSGYSTMYMHLSAIWVKSGSYVLTSTKIGAVGSTGYSTGPHLHFTVKKWGRTINPVPVLH